MKGRPTVYTKQIAAEICQRLADGEPLKQICRAEGMPPRTTVLGWVLDDREGFSDRYARARELQFEGWADEINEISDDGQNDWMERENKDGSKFTVLNGEHVQRSRLRVDSRKWLLSKLKPERYGDTMKHTGEDGGPVKIIMVKGDDKL